MTARQRKKHCPGEIVAKLHKADAMLNTGTSLAAVLLTLEAALQPSPLWRPQKGGVKREEAERLPHP